MESASGGGAVGTATATDRMYPKERRSELTNATFKLTDRTTEKFIKEHHFSGHEYEDFVKKTQE